MKLIHVRLLFALALMAFAVAATSPASAQVIAVTCAAGTEGTTYSPGITNTPQATTATITDVVGPCTGAGIGSIVWGFVSGVIHGNLSCNLIPGPVASTFTISWNDGSTSTLTFQSSIAERPVGEIVVVETHLVTAGMFLGATAVSTVTLVNTQLNACNTSQGVTAVAGPVTLAITKL